MNRNRKKLILKCGGATVPADEMHLALIMIVLAVSNKLKWLQINQCNVNECGVSSIKGTLDIISWSQWRNLGSLVVKLCVRSVMSNGKSTVTYIGGNRNVSISTNGEKNHKHAWVGFDTVVVLANNR